MNEEGKLVQYGHELLKISTIYPNRVTATVAYPLQNRTTVRSYGPQQIAKFREPSRQLVNKYDEAYGR